MASHDPDHPPPDPEPLSRQIIRTAYLFQAIVAGPTFTVLGFCAFLYMWLGNDDLYHFVTWLCTSVMAAGIIFVVVVQRKAAPGQIGKGLGLFFEGIKALCATGLWVWLMVDSVTKSYGDATKMRRITSSAVAGGLLLIFYSTLLWAVREYFRKDEVEQVRDIETREGERTPLLRERYN